MTELVSEIKGATKKSANGRVSFDAQFFDTKYCRKVYVGEDKTFSMSCPPHVHASNHVFYCVFGDNIRLATVASSGQIDIVQMMPGSWYHLARNVAHQVEMLGVGVLEVYSEKSVFRNAMVASAMNKPSPITPLEYDLFEKWHEQNEYMRQVRKSI